MAKPDNHHDDHDSLQELADIYLGRNGLSFNFAAGLEQYDYRVAIGDHNRDLLAGGDHRDYFWGLAGRDSISGGQQDDGLYGDAGDDLLVGGDGADRLTGGQGNDVLYGGMDADGLRGGKGDDYLDEGVGHGDLDGGEGNDVLVGGQGPDAFTVSPMSGDDVIRDFTPGPGMFDHLALMDLRWVDLSIADTPAGVKVSWEGGSVVLENILKEELSQDDFMFADAPDLPPGPADVDGTWPERATPSSEGPHVPPAQLPGAKFDQHADHAIAEGPLDLSFSSDETYRVVVGTSESDVIAGTSAWDHFFGLDGDDQLMGHDGDDVLQGDAGNDVLDGGADQDRIDGGMGDDRLLGGMGMDEIMGRAGNDEIDAGPGHDMIEGGEGDDLIYGGTGADAFIVDPMSGDDVVFDFEATGDAQGAFDHLALRDITPSQVSVQDGPDGALVRWNTDANPSHEGSVLLVGVYQAGLRQSDFMFVSEPGFVAGVSDYGSHLIFPA